MTLLVLICERFCYSHQKMKAALISVEFVEDVLRCVRAAGHDPAPLLAKLGLSEPITSPLTSKVYGQLWWLTAHTIQDEFLGLAARPMRPGSFAMLCYATISAGTLKQVLDRALKFLSIVLDDPRGVLHIRDKEAWIELDADTPRSAFAYRTYWLVLMGVTCWMVGRRIPVRRLDFACPAPESRMEYYQFFGAPVQFDAPVTRLCFDAAYLSLPVVRSPKSLRGFLRDAPANILIRFRHDQGTAVRVRASLTALPYVNWPTFETLAQSLNMSPATLRRQLRIDGQSFRSIKDELRSAQAQKMLSEGKLNVTEISYELGYSEPSSFFRAYRKWTGRSPRGGVLYT